MATTMIVASVIHQDPFPVIGKAFEVGSYASATDAAMQLVKEFTGKEHTREQETKFEMNGCLFLKGKKTKDKKPVGIQLISTEENGQFM
jgi:hypothetical protein